MILITGASGPYGKATIEFLLQKGFPAINIAALVRNETKAEDLKAKGVTIKIGDYDNYEALVKAFRGIDKLLFVSANDIMNRSAQHENVIKAAKETGVKHILYTSFERKKEDGTSPIAMVEKAHLETEKNIKASGIPYTIFKNNVYMDMIPMFVGEKVLETGVYLPAGETKTAFALRNDMAEATANILAGEGHQNKEYMFGNTEGVSFKQIAEIISEVSGKQVAYHSPNSETYLNTLINAGVPSDNAKLFAGFSEAIKQGEFDTTTKDLENILGRKPTSVKEFLTKVYAS